MISKEKMSFIVVLVTTIGNQCVFFYFQVFEKCQAFEKRRIDFFKKIMFDIHSCLDLSVDPR